MKFAYPLFSFLISLVFQLIFVYSEYHVPIFVLWMILYLPFTSFFYSKKFLKEGRRSMPYTLIHSFSLTFSYLMFYFTETEAYGMAVLLFLWCEVWALLGLIRKQKIPLLFMKSSVFRRNTWKNCTEKNHKS